MKYPWKYTDMEGKNAPLKTKVKAKTKQKNPNAVVN